MESTPKATRDCIKVSELRKKYGSKYNIEVWNKDPKNVYVGRYCKVNINGRVKRSCYILYASEWANIYKVGPGKDEYTLEDSLRLYEIYIMKYMLRHIHELKGKNLGCSVLPRINVT